MTAGSSALLTIRFKRKPVVSSPRYKLTASKMAEPVLVVTLPLSSLLKIRSSDSRQPGSAFNAVASRSTSWRIQSGSDQSWATADAGSPVRSIDSSVIGSVATGTAPPWSIVVSLRVARVPAVGRLPGSHRVRGGEPLL